MSNDWVDFVHLSMTVTVIGALYFFGLFLANRCYGLLMYVGKDTTLASGIYPWSRGISVFGLEAYTSAFHSLQQHQSKWKASVAGRVGGCGRTENCLVWRGVMGPIRCSTRWVVPEFRFSSVHCLGFCLYTSSWTPLSPSSPPTMCGLPTDRLGSVHNAQQSDDSRTHSRIRDTGRSVVNHVLKHTGVGIVCAVAYFDP